MPAISVTDRSIVSSRVFDYPRETVFDAWINPDLLSRWWGPKGFRNTFHKFDPKAGGQWDFTMHGPDGMNYQNRCVFEEVIKPERIIFTHLQPGHEFEVTATFQKVLEGRCKLIFEMLFTSKEECDLVRNFVLEANEENFDRLEQVLNSTAKHIGINQ